MIAIVVIMDFNTRENKQLVARVLCPSIILQMWSILVDYTTKTKFCLILGTTTLHQHSLAIRLYLKNKLLTSYVADFGWLAHFCPFHKPLLGLFHIE